MNIVIMNVEIKCIILSIFLNCIAYYEIISCDNIYNGIIFPSLNHAKRTPIMSMNRVHVRCAVLPRKPEATS